MKKQLLNRLDKYVRFATPSDGASAALPSSKQQIAFAKTLFAELKVLGLKNASLSKYGHLTAKLPSNSPCALPAIGFIAHLDTVADFAGEVKPRLVKNYKGGKIELKKGMFLDPKQDPFLNQCKGDDLMTASGDTILGADDKAGIAAIITMLEYFIKNPQVEHGPICIAFTPDEEIGRGTENFDIPGFGADFAYTVDGDSLEEIAVGNFNASRGTIKIEGVSVHPGKAKGMMVNPVRLAAEIVSGWPAKFLPETTDKENGFVLFTEVKASLEGAQVKFIAREHNLAKLRKFERGLRALATRTQTRYKGSRVSIEFADQYKNMNAVLRAKPQAINLLKKALKAENIKYKPMQIRGGTDGAMLSLRGLPCPNIFAAYSGAHGPYEWCSLDKLEGVTKLLIRVAGQKF